HTALITEHTIATLSHHNTRPPPAPRATLFPYTPLFRSPGRMFAKVTRYVRDAQAAIGVTIVRKMQRAGNKRLDVSFRERDMLLKDLKSTRLNSSHQIISYAVFCLKKKKNKKDIHIIHR